ncbi:MAG: hypothetical protein MSH10_02150 [Pygmaiobacter massiliensis]|nr:hypothetical protein [Pygmaiobacter massiliensis]
MLYLNQLEREDLAYPTDVENEADEKMHNGTVKMAGCGLCSLCMVVDRLTTETLSLLHCRDISYQVKANHGVGTDMKLLGPEVAERYGLSYATTDSVQEMIACLKNGGCAIVNVGGDREGYQGVFSHGGHFMTVISADADDELCVLDPSWRQDKWEEPGRPGKVRMEGKFVYCTPQVLAKDAENRSPSYYLFSRKK